jgi:hypothetical protein
VAKGRKSMTKTGGGRWTRVGSAESSKVMQIRTKVSNKIMNGAQPVPSDPFRR